MKKVDLHLHTVASSKDSHFEFDLDQFKRYVRTHKLDAVAITNHNLFDREQFESIRDHLSETLVLPGIEIDFDKGHLLLISDGTNTTDFSSKCRIVTDMIFKGSFIGVTELNEIFDDLYSYLLIPHYDKAPRISDAVIAQLGLTVFTGEVGSPKKFNRLKKQGGALAPVLFSDARISKDMCIENYQSCHTFLKTDTNELKFQTIVAALKDHTKVFLNNSEHTDQFQVLEDGFSLSFGLNAVIGDRSSGKTHLLQSLSKSQDTGEASVKYLKQFSLVNTNDKEFEKMLEREQGDVRQKFLERFEQVVSDVVKINRKTSLHKLGEFVDSLLKYAASEKLQDEFSGCILFQESPFPRRADQELNTVLNAVITLIEAKAHGETVKKWVNDEILRGLLAELRAEFIRSTVDRLRQEWVNQVMEEISTQLHSSSSSPHIKHVNTDIFEFKLERERIRTFNAIAKALSTRRTLGNKAVGSKFTIASEVLPIESAKELKELSGIRPGNFKDSFDRYSDPFDYLQMLKGLEVDVASLYKLFCKVSYKVLNERRKPVSGGERTEFNLLRQLEDALQYEILLVDEPESSFDNIFLATNVNDQLKTLSTQMPVVVATHSSTVAMLLKPDRIIYASREVNEAEDRYFLYACSPGETEMKTVDGLKVLSSREVLLGSLEAGEAAYKQKKNLYDNFRRSV